MTAQFGLALWRSRIAVTGQGFSAAFGKDADGVGYRCDFASWERRFYVDARDYQVQRIPDYQAPFGRILCSCCLKFQDGKYQKVAKLKCCNTIFGTRKLSQ